jgi:hypothetical protein
MFALPSTILNSMGLTFHVCSLDTQAQVHIQYQVTCSVNMQPSSSAFLLLELTINFNLKGWKLQTEFSSLNG